MARYRTAEGERYIEADNGFGWTRRRGSPALSIESGVWTCTVFGVTYRLVKYANPRGWHLYSDQKPSEFWAKLCGTTLLPAIDEASELIAKADLRGEGYEKETQKTC